MKSKMSEYIRNVGIFIVVYAVLVGIFYIAAGPQITYNEYKQQVLTTDSTLGELVDTDVIEQTFVYTGDYIEKLVFHVATYNRVNHGVLTIQLYQGNDLMFEEDYDVKKIKDNSKLEIPLRIETEGEETYRVRMTTAGCSYGNAITFYSNGTSDIHQGTLSRNDVPMAGEIQFDVEGGTARWLGTVFFKVAVIAGLVAGLLWGLLIHQLTYSEHAFWKEIRSIGKYGFLLKQLVSRDFKTKYKRSVLGFCWSFLNPVLTMVVQYIVFSTLFRSDIDNFPVYLLSAGIFFNFFTESVGAGLGAIVGNVSLITKVYVPKYIYPLSRVLSTAINLLISLIPLMLTVLLTGEEITAAFLLIPFGLLCLVVFCIGMAFILSSSMVFFRDTQFLWGIISLIWMYGTPIFYPETIIPDKFRFVLVCNPMYHYLKYFRTILLTGNSPALVEYVFCLGFAVFVFAAGLLIFKKTEKKFVLYL